MDKREFINRIKDGALKGYTEHKIVPSLTIAQAILESGWGSSKLSLKANNLFGVKATKDWRGERVTLPTTEWYSNQKKIVNADFRVYESFNHSIEDHNKILSYARYKPVRECNDYKDACQKVYECGYATDPGYAAKLIKIIEDNKLYEFDSINISVEAAVSVENGKVRKFQHLCNVLGIRDNEGRALVEDNILGSRTKSCINKMPVLKVGSTGPAVEFIQDIVNAVPIDGDFGPITHQRVIEYQKQKGITADGIVGKQTWTTIIS